MSEISSKAEAVSKIVIKVIALLLLVFPIENIIIRVAVYLLATFTAILYFVALLKKEPWDSVYWVWSAFFFPVFSAAILIVGYIGQFFSVETIAVWGLPVYLSLTLPFAWVLMKYFRIVCAESIRP